MKYFVAPSKETRWRLSPSELERAIRSRWPSATVRSPESQTYAALSYEVPIGTYPLSGSLHANHQTLAFEDDLSNVADFALWIRELVPAEEPLVFFTDDGTCIVPLIRGSTTRQDLLRAVEANRRP